nr:CcoQ/FixQ family Cbb3-type cytochrome c oxidase assembly chaperone [uncultured Steroidobacter sp.]
MSIEFNMGLVRGLLTLILFLAFMTLWAWAWNKHRKPEFDRMARLPLEDQERIEERPR